MKEPLITSVQVPVPPTHGAEYVAPVIVTPIMSARAPAAQRIAASTICDFTPERSIDTIPFFLWVI
jgi:hypothetical protein